MAHLRNIFRVVCAAGFIGVAAIATGVALSPQHARFLAIPGVGAAAAAETPRANARDKAPAKKKTRAPRDPSFGREGDPRKVTRVIKVEMSDAMRYFPEHISVKKGQTVRFQVHNGGQVPHEMVLGTMDDLKKHAAMMKKHGEQQHEPDEPNIAHVEPGATGRIVWHFTRAGEFYFGCLVPGHFEAGMIGTIVVR